MGSKGLCILGINVKRAGFSETQRAAASTGPSIHTDCEHRPKYGLPSLAYSTGARVAPGGGSQRLELGGLVKWGKSQLLK